MTPIRNLIRRSLLLLLVPAIVAPLALAQAAPSETPTPNPPPKSWIDPDTGHRVVRLTDEPGSASFYFNVNSYTPDGREMVYTTHEGISVLDLTTFKSRPVVKGRVFTIVVGHKTPNVFYFKPDEHALYETNVDTGVTRKLVTLPEQAFVSTINADETLAAGAMIIGDRGENLFYGNRDRRGHQSHSLIQPRNKGEMMERRLAAHLPMVLFTIDLRTGKMKTLLHSTEWLNHLQFSPTDPTLLLYCHEGPWQKVDRIWTIRTDGTHNMLIHKRTMFMEIAGHEFWSPDGKTIWYDWQTPKGEDFWLAGYNVETGRRVAYHMQRNEWSIHFNVSRDGKLFCGDGGDPGQVAHAPDGEWIYLFHPQMITDGPGAKNSPDFIQPGVFHAERLVNMKKHNYHLEPNVSFTPDGKWVIFRSNMFGPTYVFGVQVAKADTANAPR